MSISDLHPVIHAPKRLAVMAILSHSTDTDFSFLREYLDVTDSDLSKQMSILQRAGYVNILKAGRSRGASTTYSITHAGKRAYNSHLTALHAITGMSSP